MAKDFVDSWARKTKTPLTTSVRERINAEPLRERITKTNYRLKTVQRRLEDRQARLNHKERELFTKCIRAQEAKEATTSTMYANECAQIRKMIQTLITSQLALEQVVLRLETVQDFGDVAAEIVPAAAIVRTVKGSLAGVIPEASMMLDGIGQTLDGLVMEVGEATGMSWNINASGEEAEKILAEAVAVAEEKMKEHFPALPGATAPESGVNPP